MEFLKENDGIIWVDLKIVQKISTFEGFNNIFEANLTKKITFSAAYEATEDVHESIFGQRKYSSYDSFAHVKKTYQRNRSLFFKKRVN